MSSSLTWRDLGLKIKQTASFTGPDQTALTKLEFESNSSSASPQIVVKLRVPGWVAEGAAEVFHCTAKHSMAQQQLYQFNILC